MGLRPRSKSERQSEAGVALLIAICALLLISVVAIALVVSSGTDSALAGNYRTATSAYYAAVAGLEEARGRLLYKNPDYINKSSSYNDLFPPGQGTNFQLNDVLYIINPANSETVDPTDSSGPYYDNEFLSEFQIPITGATLHTPSVTSVSPMGGFPGPTFKWVRINAITEKGLGLDVDGLHANDGTTLLYFNGSGLYRCLTAPNCAGNPQALELTTLAVMPDKSTKLLQYIVVPNSLQFALAPPPLQWYQGFPAALTLAGNGVTYSGPDSSGFYVNGNDPTTGRTCANPALSPVSAIGYTNSADQPNVVSGIPTAPVNVTGNYQGFAPPPPAAATPSVGQVSLPPTLQKPSQMEALIQTISQSADIVLSPTPPGTTVPGSAVTTAASGIWPTTPLTIVINGDLDLTSWHNTGYGLLLVTGNLIYDPDASWQGIVLVIGKGTITGSHAGIGQFNGAVMVARSRDPISGVVLADPNLGAASVSFASNMGGNGIYFNSCTILQALTPTNFKVLSFREISQ